MAEIGALYPTLHDLAKRTDPNGAIAKVVEVLQKMNPMIEDISFKEGNLPTGDRFTSRTALPTPQWRSYNGGITPSKTETDQVDETCGMLEGLSKVDKALANLGGNAAAHRADEDKAFVQGFAIEVERAFLYESLKSNANRIHGLTPRLDGPVASHPAAAQIVKADSIAGAAASGVDMASIWLVGWGPDSVCGIVPKGSRVGLSHEDLGTQLVAAPSGGGEMVALVTHWKWDLGLEVKDSRYLARCCNIDTSILKADLSTGTDLTLCMLNTYTALKEVRSVQPVFYMNRTVFTMWNAQLIKKGTTEQLQWVMRGGQLVAHFMGVPIRISDTLTNAESIVS